MKKFYKWVELPIDGQIERFAHAVKVIERLDTHTQAKHFDMGMWGFETDYGTVACAVGHCALDKWFNKQGLIGVMHKYAQDEYSHLSFTKGIAPEDFFGRAACIHIFMNDELTAHKGKAIYKKVLKAMRDYLAYLEANKFVIESKYYVG